MSKDNKKQDAAKTAKEAAPQSGQPANQAPAQPEMASLFRLNGLYVKDISFENPRAPGIFLQPPAQQPKMGVNIDVGMKRIQGATYEVVLRITTKAQEEGVTLFLVEVQHGGVFTINPNIPEEHHARILFVDCASVIFPFARRVISDLTTEGGFPPFLLEPINFEAIYLQKTGRAA